MPVNIKKNDEKSYSEITIDISKADPTELSRVAADGDRKYQLGIIEFPLYLSYY